MTRRVGRREDGQILILFALATTAIILLVGLVIDGGYALLQRRASQNAADFAALSGARIVAVKIAGDTVNGTDANALAAIVGVADANRGAAITTGAPNGPVYVNSNGAATGFVGAGTIPTGIGRRARPDERLLAPLLHGPAGRRPVGRRGGRDGPRGLRGGRPGWEHLPRRNRASQLR